MLKQWCDWDCRNFMQHPKHYTSRCAWKVLWCLGWDLKFFWSQSPHCQASSSPILPSGPDRFQTLKFSWLSDPALMLPGWVQGPRLFADYWTSTDCPRWVWDPGVSGWAWQSADCWFAPRQFSCMCGFRNPMALELWNGKAPSLGPHDSGHLKSAGSNHLPETLPCNP